MEATENSRDPVPLFQQQVRHGLHLDALQTLSRLETLPAKLFSGLELSAFLNTLHSLGKSKLVDRVWKAIPGLAFQKWYSGFLTGVYVQHAKDKNFQGMTKVRALPEWNSMIPVQILEELAQLL